MGLCLREQWRLALRPLLRKHMGTLGLVHWIVLLVVIPLVLVLRKKGVARQTKLLGFFAVFSLSWIGYLMFYLIAPKQQKA